MDKAFFTRASGKSLANVGHWQASNMAARCPPAEWPTIVMRSGSPPCTAMWRYTQASARTICMAISGIVTAGQSA